MKAILISLCVNSLIFGSLFTSLNHTTQGVAKVAKVAMKAVEALPPIVSRPAPFKYNKRALKVLSRVVCGEVGAHQPSTGRNVLQVIINRANLKVSKTNPLDKALIASATRTIGKTPQFARYCRKDSKRAWQTEIAKEALRGEWVGDADWLTENTLFFRTHVGAHRWEKKKGWTRNISKVGADLHHTFFDGNKLAVDRMAKY